MGYASMPACVPGDGLVRRAQRLHEGHQRSHFRGTQILAIRRHVAASLDDLPDQLIVSQTDRDRIESWAPQSAFSAQAVTVPALLALHQDRALKLERRPPVNILRWNWRSAPCFHMR